MMFGRNLNPRTMMWEFADGSGVAIPHELMPRPGDSVVDFIATKDRLENMNMATSGGGNG